MLRWTAESAGPPLEGAPRVPHAATLIGGALVALALLIPLRLRAPEGLNPGWLIPTAIGLLVAFLSGVGLLTLRGLRRRSTLLAGLLLLDLLPLLVVLAATSSAGRSRGLLLMVPTVIAALDRNRLVPVAQAIAAGLSGTAILVLTNNDPQAAALEIAAFLGALAAVVALTHGMALASVRRLDALRKLALTDRLTGALNRRGLVVGFAKVVDTAARRRTEVGLVLLDIDHFKRINDAYGHAHGDIVLRGVADLVRDAVGPDGVFARTGGEELAAVVPGAPGALAIRIRAALATADLNPPITASMGVVSARPEDCARPDRVWVVLDAADQALYRAKNDGRDRVRRGSADFTIERVRPPAAPRSFTVPTPPFVPGRRDSAWFGAAMIFLSLTGFAAYLAPARLDRDSPAAFLMVGGLVAGLVCGIFLTTRRPAAPRAILPFGAFAADLVILMGILASTDPDGRRHALCVLMIPALLVAQYLDRRTVAAHHVLITAICGIAAYQPDMPVPFWLSTWLITTGVLVGSTETVFRVRARHDIAAVSLHEGSVTDPLTGLANRRGLEMAFGSIDRDSEIRLLALDVDGFKDVNDRYGHSTGDDALSRLAVTLVTVSDPGAIVARTGGDEFAVVCAGMSDGAAQRIRAAAALLPLPLSVSVGSAVSQPGSAADVWELLAHADARLTDRRRRRRGLVQPRGAAKVPAQRAGEPSAG